MMSSEKQRSHILEVLLVITIMIDIKELAEYGGTTWDARSEAVNQLGKYVKEETKHWIYL